MGHGHGHVSGSFSNFNSIIRIYRDNGVGLVDVNILKVDLVLILESFRKQ